jgi:hypothetical protein
MNDRFEFRRTNIFPGIFHSEVIEIRVSVAS